MGRKIHDVAAYVREHSVEDESGCWIWQNDTSSNGYGQIKPAGSKRLPAHRASYVAFKGEIPDGLYIDHLCRVRACVNPDHLEPVTHEENVRRGLGGVLGAHCGPSHVPPAERPGRVCPGCARQGAWALADRVRDDLIARGWTYQP